MCIVNSSTSLKGDTATDSQLLDQKRSLQASRNRLAISLANTRTLAAGQSVPLPPPQMTAIKQHRTKS